MFESSKSGTVADTFLRLADPCSDPSTRAASAYTDGYVLVVKLGAASTLVCQLSPSTASVSRYGRAVNVCIRK